MSDLTPGIQWCQNADPSKEILVSGKLDTFDGLWHIPGQWVEEPNSRGTARWGGVIKYQHPETESSFFVKLQQNYTRRTLRHPVRGENLARLEYDNFQKHHALWEFAAPPVLYAERFTAGKLQSILVIKGLDDYLSLEDFMQTEQFLACAHYAKRALASVGKRLFDFHSHGYLHSSLYKKHIFIQPHTLDVRLIDFERLRQLRSPRKAATGDLSRFFKRTPELSNTAFFSSFMASYRESSAMMPVFTQLQGAFSSPEESP